MTLLALFVVCFLGGFAGGFCGLLAAVWYCNRGDR